MSTSLDAVAHAASAAMKSAGAYPEELQYRPSPKMIYCLWKLELTAVAEQPLRNIFRADGAAEDLHAASSVSRRRRV
jgi:hypothetical protein